MKRTKSALQSQRRLGCWFLASCALFGAGSATGDGGNVGSALLAGIFRDHAVLQRDRPIAVWGYAAAGEDVTVSLGQAITHTQADAAGHWHANLPAMSAGGPFELKAQTGSGRAQSASDVLVGDIFLCSGQSNMEFPVDRTGDAYSEIATSTNPRIRMVTVEHAASPTPLAEFTRPLEWQLAGPQTVSHWSAACFYFARELQKNQPVPIGLVHSSWGGSNIRPWMSAAAFRSLGGYESALNILTLYAKDQTAAQRQFAEQWEAWWREKTGDRPGSEPWTVESVNGARRMTNKHQARPAPTLGEWLPAPAGLGDWRYWGVAELRDFTGLIWYRTHIHLSASQAKSAARLDLGSINQVDETWLNGRALGNTFGYGTERSYAIPAGALHAGDNVLVVNVLSTYGGGGLLAGGAQRALQLSSGESITLAGPWEYRVVPPNVGYPPRAPWEPIGGVTTLYNAMIAPLGSYGLRGALWYQGESNADEWQTYQKLLSALMADWRRQFSPDLPFLVVQLPNYGRAPTEPGESSNWASLREAQRAAVAADAHAALAVTIDIGEPRNLHPTNKQDVGKRLARAARHVIYGEPLPPSGPVAVSAISSGGQIVVNFRDIENGLVAYSHDRPIGFELCGAVCRFAQSSIDGSKIVLPVPQDGPKPTRVRYCWADSPVCTLFDRSGLPAGPFELPITQPNTAAGQDQLTAEKDHQRLLDLLHIKELRRGPDGDPSSPRHANFDESKVEPYQLPDPLVTDDGKRVRTPDEWWKRRRPQIVELFDREVYGRVPRDVPKVTWHVERTDHESRESKPLITKHVVGHLDNSADPDINVDIQLTLTTPAGAAGPVPVIMELGLSPETQTALRKRFTDAQWAQIQGSGPDWRDQVLAKGWGYAIYIPTSVQPDNGAGLTRGVIGLSNRGQPRKLEDWGALRAWAWGASRALDYLETDKSVDARHVGIEGLSRYGKATLVAMAYDSRFAIAFVGSSGQGGGKIARRAFGEQVENLAAVSEYHWVAGNYLKYAGPLTPNDLPVDAHELIALCAPRPVFISAGAQEIEGGWIDAKGMFLGAVGASPVYELLGKKGLGTSQFPPLETALIDGDLAWRQHRAGHTTGPNWPTFLQFASRYFPRPTPAPAAANASKESSFSISNVTFLM